MFAICSAIASGMLTIGASGPNVFVISFRYCMSALFTALSNGAVIIYNITKIIAPIINSIQLANCS